MKLYLSLQNRTEKIHFLDDNIQISSHFNVIKYISDDIKHEVRLPINLLEKFLGLFRITRRLFRLDMCNVFLSNRNLVILRKGLVYHFNIDDAELSIVLKLEQSRNILNQSMCETSQGDLYFGEYSMNPKQDPVNVYRSKDNGKSWSVLYTFPAGKIRHVHGCYFDKFTNKIWTLTGDFEGQNIIQCSDLNFEEIETFGDGSQSYRAVSLFFTKYEVHWIMDSPVEKNYHFSLNRNSKEVKKLDCFNGPVWYLKELVDGYYLAGSSVEIGDGVLTNNACLYLSKDLKTWEIISEFTKDKWPMPYFKWGVLAFSSGRQSSKKFTIHFEGLKKLDGKAFICSISQNNYE